MTRKKVKLVWIVNDSARKASLKKRRLGLVKKVSELITLCGVEAFIIIYSPDEDEPVIWPPSKADVERLITRYMAMPEMERCKKLTNQETYMKERMGKVHDQSKKSHKKNKDSELGYLMFQVHRGKGLDQFETVELHGLAWLVEDRMKDLRKRIEYFRLVSPLDQRHGGSEDVDVGGESGVNVLQGKMTQNPNEPMSWDQWFLDMVHNTEGNVAGGASNISTRGGSEMGLQYPPHGFGPYGSVNMGYDRFHGNVGPGMIMYPPPSEHEGHEYGQFPGADMGGGNPFGMTLQPHPLPPPYHGGIGGDGSGGTMMGMHGFYGGEAGGRAGPSGPGSEMGLPNYDVSNPHWSNYL